MNIQMIKKTVQKYCTECCMIVTDKDNKYKYCPYCGVPFLEDELEMKAALDKDIEERR